MSQREKRLSHGILFRELQDIRLDISSEVPTKQLLWQAESENRTH